MENGNVMMEFIKEKRAVFVGDRMGGWNYFCVKLTGLPTFETWDNIKVNTKEIDRLVTNWMRIADIGPVSVSYEHDNQS